jgi:hypothetical protein
VNSSTSSGTALCQAAQAGQTDIVAFLLNVADIDIWAQNSDHNTAFVLAARAKCLSTFKLLTDTGRDQLRSDVAAVNSGLLAAFSPDLRNSAWNTWPASSSAPIAGDEDLIAFFMRFPVVDVTFAQFGSPILSKAIGFSNATFLELALKCATTNSNVWDRNGHTPLMYAAEVGTLDDVRLLAEIAETQLERTSISHETALSLAAHVGSIEIVAYLAGLVCPTQLVQALVATMLSGHLDVARHLIGLDFDVHGLIVVPPNVTHWVSGRRPSAYAADYWQTKSFVASSCWGERSLKPGEQMPLIFACVHPQAAPFLALLLTHPRFDPLRAGEVLFAAIEANNPIAFQALVAAGVSLRPRDNSTESLLCCAVLKRALAIIRLLIALLEFDRQE